MLKSTPSLSVAFLLAILNATIIGLSFLFAKIAVTQVGAFDTLTYRFILAIIIFGMFLPFQTEKIRFRWSTFFQLLPLAVSYPIAFFTFQAFGLLYTSSAEAGILTATAPILTAILAAVALKERTNLLQYAAIALSVAGVIYMTLMKHGDDSHTGNLLGYALIILSCCSSAAYTIFNRVAIRSLGPMEITFYLMLAGVVFFTPISLGTHLANGTIETFFRQLGDDRLLISILFLGILSSLLTTIVASIALKRLASAQFVAFLNLSTVVAILAGWIFLNEQIRFHHLLGTAMILLGVVGTNYFSSSRAR